MNRLVVAATLLSLPFAAGAAAQEDSPYAHAGSDLVKTLSQDEVDELLEGAGMGLARPAELNGLPGPRHVLGLADSLGLTPEQRRSVEAAFEDMDTEARGLGRRVIDAEIALDSLFAAGTPDPDAIRDAVERAAGLRARLRLVHLAAHVRVAGLLTPHQIHEYARLRGYAEHEHDGS